MPGSLKFPDNDFPDFIPGDFKELINIGKKTINVEIFGVLWSFATLEEWEERLIEKKLNGLDDSVKRKLRPVEILTHAIQSCIILKTNRPWDFSTEDKKIILRSILLIDNPMVCHYIFKAYQIMIDVAFEEFRNNYPKIEEELKNQILGKEIKKDKVIEKEITDEDGNKKGDSDKPQTIKGSTKEE